VPSDLHRGQHRRARTPGMGRHEVPDRARVETALAGGPESGGYVAIALSAPRHADRRGERLP